MIRLTAITGVIIIKYIVRKGHYIMKKYGIVFGKSFKSQMIYRAATLSSVAGTLLAFAFQL